MVLAAFVFGAPLPVEFDFVHIGAIGAAVLVVGGALAIAGGATRRPVLCIAAGILLTVAAVAQLVGLALSLRPLGGDASTMSVTGGLGIGLLAIGLTARPHVRAPASDER